MVDVVSIQHSKSRINRCVQQAGHVILEVIQDTHQGARIRGEICGPGGRQRSKTNVGELHGTVMFLTVSLQVGDVILQFQDLATGRGDLTHFPLVPHICVRESGQHWFRQWLVTYSTQSHSLNQYWVIVNWTLRNKIQWNFNQNTKPFIDENASGNIVCKKVAILSRGRGVNTLTPE